MTVNKDQRAGHDHDFILGTGLEFCQYLVKTLAAPGPEAVDVVHQCCGFVPNGCQALTEGNRALSFDFSLGLDQQGVQLAYVIQQLCLGHFGDSSHG